MGGGADLLQILARLVAAFGADQQLGEADDGLQRVVELVGHARNELADRGEPLVVNQLISKQRLVRGVAFDGDEIRQRRRPASVSATMLQVERNVDSSWRRRINVPRHARSLRTAARISSSCERDSSARNSARVMRLTSFASQPSARQNAALAYST